MTLFRNSRRHIWILVALFVLAMGYRAFSIYPPELRHGPATVALQACQIMNGEHPIFWPGQTYMGTAGMHLEALIFKVFGPTLMNTLTLSIFAWLTCALWIALIWIMAFRFFGFQAALWTALFWLIPSGVLMYWACQARPDYQFCFVAAPLILILAHGIVCKFEKGEAVGGWLFGMGLVCGLSFWNNMAIGPAIAMASLVLLWRLKLQFFWKRIALYGIGGILGFSPVLYYNLTHSFPLSHQTSFKNVSHLSQVFHRFFENAHPFFWGMDIKEPGTPQYWLGVVFLAWVVLMFVLCAWQAFRKWQRGEEVLGEVLVLGYFFGHMLVTSSCHYGERFGKPNNPVLYITVLYSVAFVIPALALARLPLKARMLCALPLLIFMGSNVRDTYSYPVKFFEALKKQGMEAVRFFPHPQSPYLEFCKEHHLDTGYMYYLNKFLNLDCLGSVTFSDASKESHLNFALKADSAKRIFWLEFRDNMKEIFNAVGCRFKKTLIHDSVSRLAFYDFEKDPVPEVLITGFAAEASSSVFQQHFMNDRNIDTFWATDSDNVPEGTWLGFSWNDPLPLHKIVLIPENTGTVPEVFQVQVSEDGKNWKTVMQVKNGTATFWSVYHPFGKVVKPRMEIELPTPTLTRHVRLLLEEQKKSVAVREVYLYARAEGETPSFESWDKAVEAVLAEVKSQGGNRVVTGDHWFMNRLALEKIPVEFISNYALDSYGFPNPHEYPTPLNLKKPHLFIVSKAHSLSVEETLKKHALSFQKKPFPFQDLFFVEAAASPVLLQWDGLGLNEINPKAKGTRLDCGFAPLKSFFPDTREREVMFGKDDEFRMSASRVAHDALKRNVCVQFEITPLKEADRAYYLFIHFCDASGKILFQGDLRMQHSFGTTETWEADKRVLLESNAVVPEGVSGEIQVRVGIWHPDSGKRLSINHGEDIEFVLDTLKV